MKHSFKVLSRKGTSLQSYVLQANDEQDRQHWLQSIQTAVESIRATTAADDDSFLPGPSVSRGSSFTFCNEPSGLGDIGSCAGSLSSLNSMFSTDSYESGHTLRTRAQMVGKAADVEEKGATKS